MVLISRTQYQVTKGKYKGTIRRRPHKGKGFILRDKEYKGYHVIYAEGTKSKFFEGIEDARRFLRSL